MKVGGLRFRNAAAVIVGAVSLLVALAAGDAVVADTWLRPAVAKGARQAPGSMARALAPSDPIMLWTIGILAACLIYYQLRVPDRLRRDHDQRRRSAGDRGFVLRGGAHRRTDRCPAGTWTVRVGFAQPHARLPVSSRPRGRSRISGADRGRTLFADTFVIAALATCATQVLAYVMHLYVVLLQVDFFGYLFVKSGQLEGYAQNSNAVVFQLLMAVAVLIASGPQPGRWSVAGWLFATGALLPQNSYPRIANATPATRPTTSDRRETIDRLIIEPFNRAWRPHADESDALRWQSTALGLQAWLRHPILGYGLGTFLLEREIAGLPAVVIHSVPIRFLAELGIFGLAGYVLFGTSLVSYGISTLQRLESQARGLLIVVVVFVLMGLVHDGFFQRTFWFAYGLFLVVSARLGQRPQEAGSLVSEASLELTGGP